ncbi:hypothetical protein BGZ67_007539 [Mortierella alpina]|nr:hypothetical protein BGZ67_007539 [Mortierella alpina]
MVIMLRGLSKRTLTIVFGLCVFCALFMLTPYKSKGLNHDPKSWRDSKISTTKQERNLEHQAQYKQQAIKDTEEKLELSSVHDNNRILLENPALNGKKRVIHTKTRTNTAKAMMKQENAKKPMKTEETDGTEQEHDDNDPVDETQEALPTKFDLSKFPSASQMILENTIGAEALKQYISQKSHQAARNVAVGYILRQANTACRNNTIYSVVIKPKSKVAPSGDIHDYTSLARYFYRNPDTPNGLPYVRHDGKPNPEMDTVWDYRLLRKMFRDCYYMGQAYFWTGDERYAEKTVHRVKQWFLDPETRMNPNVKYGSWIFGESLGRAQGVLDMFKVYGVFEALKAIKDSKAMQAEPNLISELQTWFRDYMVWLDSSEEAHHEMKARNNHGTYFTVQYLSILEFLGSNAEAKALAEEAKIVRVGPQIRKDGAQPYETERPISYYYSTFNLQGLILLAMQAASHDVDLWHYSGLADAEAIQKKSKKEAKFDIGGTIEDAIRYIADYGVRDPSEWPYPDSGARPLIEVLKMARIASLVYGRDRWQKSIEDLTAKINEGASGEDKSGDEDSEDGDGGDGGATDEDSNVFICELGILSHGRLWHCFK